MMFMRFASMRPSSVRGWIGRPTAVGALGAHCALRQQSSSAPHRGCAAERVGERLAAGLSAGRQRSCWWPDGWRSCCSLRPCCQRWPQRQRQGPRRSWPRSTPSSPRMSSSPSSTGKSGRRGGEHERRAASPLPRACARARVVQIEQRQQSSSSARPRAPKWLHRCLVPACSLAGRFNSNSLQSRGTRRHACATMPEHSC